MSAGAVDFNSLAQKITEIAAIVAASNNQYQLKDDLAQEIWIYIPNIIKKWDPEKGSIEAFICGYAKKIFLVMLRKLTKEVYPKTIENTPIEGSYEIAFHELQEKITREDAVRKIQKKLEKKGLKSIEVPKKTKRPANTNQEENNNFRQLVQKIPLPKAQIAKKLGISPQLLNAYLTGKTKKIPINITCGVVSLFEEYEKNNQKN